MISRNLTDCQAGRIIINEPKKGIWTQFNADFHRFFKWLEIQHLSPFQVTVIKSFKCQFYLHFLDAGIIDTSQDYFFRILQRLVLEIPRSSAAFDLLFSTKSMTFSAYSLLTSSIVFIFFEVIVST